MASKLKLLTFIIIFLSFGFSVTSSILSKQSQTLSEYAKVKEATLEEKLTLSGSIDAEEKVTLRFKSSGKLTWIGVKEGDHVNKYQVIATQDQREVKKTLEKDLNDYLKSRWSYDQTREDYKNTYITDSIKRIIDKSQFDLNNAVLDVELQNLSVEFANLNTPIEGVVTRVTSQFPGVYNTPTQAEFDVVNPKTLLFIANADQTEVTQLREGIQGILTLDAYPDRTIDGFIQSISFTPKTNESSTVYAVKFDLGTSRASTIFRIGMVGDVTFVTNKKESVLSLPVKFVKSENGKKYVKVLKNGKLVKRYVTIGMETDTSYEISSGLEKGATVYN